MFNAFSLRQFGAPSAALAESYFSDARRLMDAAEKKAPIRGHSERVALLALSIAHHLRFNERLQRLIWLGAMLHDVGKAGIERDVLAATDDLIPDDQARILAHTEAGYAAIAATGTLDERVALVARQHHENWDGTGYPNGLHGESILVEARIVRVADCYDMLLHGFPGRPAMTKYQALSHMLEGAGRIYDPLFVDVLGTVG